MTKFLVVDDEPADLALLKGLLDKQGHEVLTAKTAQRGLDLMRREQPEVAILDILLPDENGLEVYSQMRALDGRLPIIFVTASGSSNTAIEAMQLGALDYLTKPLNVAEVKAVIERALEVRRMTSDPVTMDPPAAGPDDGDVIIGRSGPMQQVYKSIGLVASQDVTVLIRGESGSGKELVARAIYQFSKRSDGPFLAVNCAAIPEMLLESELFGHEKGAFDPLRWMNRPGCHPRFPHSSARSDRYRQSLHPLLFLLRRSWPRCCRRYFRRLTLTRHCRLLWRQSLFPTHPGFR